MKIGILGTGNIGKTLVTRLSQAGHEVKVANSRGPDTIDAELLSVGARAVTTEDAALKSWRSGCTGAGSPPVKGAAYSRGTHSVGFFPGCGRPVADG